MISFAIELAGVPAGIRCRFEDSRTFLTDYITEKEPLFSIEPTDRDLARMQTDFDRMDAADGLPGRRRTDAFLENNAIYALLAERLVEHGVLLMHGSALSMDGSAIIFTARSGTGKSTHSRLWREVFGDRVVMINDDKPMLKIGDDRAEVCGTPWDGKHHLSRNFSAPLKAVVSLERDTVNHIEPLSKADAFPVLMRQCYRSEDPVTMSRILELEKHLLGAARFYKLGCNMSPEAARVAFEGMNHRQ